MLIPPNLSIHMSTPLGVHRFTIAGFEDLEPDIERPKLSAQSVHHAPHFSATRQPWRLGREREREEERG